MKKLLFFILFLFPILNFAQCEVKGKIKIVSFGEDYKVRKVGLGDAYVNLKVKLVEFGYSYESGEWEIVNYGEDFKIRFVDYGEDFTIQFVDYDYGCGSNSSRGVNPALIDRSAETLSNSIDGVINAIDNNPAIWNNRASKKYKKGDYRGALPLFEQAIKLAKGDVYEGLYYYNRGLTLKNLGMSYCGDFNKACQLRHPDGCKAYKNYCSSNRQQNTNFNSSNKNQFSDYIKSGGLKLKSKDFYGAIADYRKAIEINPNHSYGYAGKGIAKDALKDYNGAITDFNKALELKPDYFEVYLHRGASKAKVNDHYGAIADFNQAIEISPNNREISAQIYRLRGNSKAWLKLDYCSDYKIACDLGSCNSFNEKCKMKLNSSTLNNGDNSSGINEKYNSSIVIGSFGAMSNAERQKQTLIREGFDNIDISKVGNVYRVSVLVSGSKEKVQEVHKRVKVYHKSAWISYK